MRIRKDIFNKIFFFLFIFILFLIVIFLANITPGLKGSLDQELRILLKQNEKILNASLKKTFQNLYGSINNWDSNEKNYDTLQINISFRNMKILRDERKKALRIKYNLSRKKIPIQINYKNEIYKASARLKGGLSDHYGNNKQFSLMIKLKNNKSINGMSEFALTQHYTRQYPNNIFYSEILSALGLSAPNFITYKINLNGDDWGLMLAEEQYSNKYFETRNKEYYPTIKLTNEDNSDLRRILYSNFGSKIDEKTYKFFEYRHGKIENRIFNNNDFSGSEFSEIKSYLKDIKYNLVKNNIDSSELDLIFDMDKMSKIFILTFLTGDYHVLGFRNIRFHYNVKTSKLEPIPTDWGIGLRKLISDEQLKKELFNMINCFVGCTYHNFVIYDKIIKNSSFQEAFNKNLNIFRSEFNKNKKNLDNLCKFQINCLNKIDMISLDNNLEILQDKINYFEVFNKQYSIIEKPFLNSDLNVGDEVRDKYFEILKNAVFIRVFSNGNLKIINLTPYPIEIYKIKFLKQDCLKKNDEECTEELEKNINLQVTDLDFFNYNLNYNIQNYKSILVYSKYKNFYLSPSEFEIENENYLESVKRHYLKKINKS